MKTRMLRIVRCLAVAAAGMVMATPGQAAQKPDMDSIVAALKQQEANCGASLQVKYTVDWFPPSEDRRLFEQITYIRTPHVLFKEGTKGARVPSGESKVEWNRRIRYDRVSGEFRSLAVAPSGSPKIGYVYTSKEIANRFVGSGILDPVLYWTSLGPVSKATKESSIADAQEDIDGHPCWRIGMPERQTGSDTRESWTIWVDPKVGFCPRRIVNTFKQPGKVIVVVSDFSDYKLLTDQVYFPMALTVKHEGEETRGLRFSVQEATCNKAVSPEKLVVTYPSGTKVYDIGKGTDYTQP